MLCKMHDAPKPVRCRQRASTVLPYEYCTLLYRSLSYAASAYSTLSSCGPFLAVVTPCSCLFCSTI
jgi:hypothetical protein